MYRISRHGALRAGRWATTCTLAIALALALAQALALAYRLVASAPACLDGAVPLRKSDRHDEALKRACPAEARASLHKAPAPGFALAQKSPAAADAMPARAPVAKATLAPASTVPVTAAPVLPAPDAREAVLAAATAWARAWSGGHWQAYRASYDTHFLPADGLSQAAWEAERLRRVADKQGVDVRLGNIQVVHLDERTAELRFTQTYTSPGYADQGEKSLYLVRRSSGWKIMREIFVVGRALR